MHRVGMVRPQHARPINFPFPSCSVVRRGRGPGREGERKPAAQPVPTLRRRAEVGETKTFQREGFETAGQRLGRLRQQIGRSAAKNEKARRQRPAIGEHAQKRKEFWPALDFVDHDQSTKRSQGRFRFAQPGDPRRVFQIDVIDRIAPHELTSERGFARLTRTEESDHPAPLQGRHE